jgi:hypothetical protein
MQQQPPTIDDISVVFPSQPQCQALEEMVMVDTMKFFMAKPTAASVPYSALTLVQQWAVDIGIDLRQQIVMYLWGKAGSGKTEVALHICERMKGHVQAGAGTGKAASNLQGPTVHGMFGWSFDGYSVGRQSTLSARKLGELKALYERFVWISMKMLKLNSIVICDLNSFTVIFSVILHSMLYLLHEIK